MDQLRRWVHRHSDTSPPRRGGCSAGSQGGDGCSDGVGQ